VTLPQPVVTRSRLVRDALALGVAPGGVLMLHASVRSIGWVVGGPDVVLDALTDALGPDGSLMMYVGWADGTYSMDEWTPEEQLAHEQECPAFDPATSRAVRDWSILTEFLRTRPGAHRSANPEASIAAVGARAAWLTADHPLDYGYGAGSPLAKLIEARGQVLLLGSPLTDVTLIHHAECRARVPDKRVARYRQPVLRGGQRQWVTVEEFDTNGLVDWEGEDYFGLIVQAYLDAGLGRTGLIGGATCHLLDAVTLDDFAVRWMEEHF
jgi:aminoglycoside 3-N-acetyltransferase